MKLKNFFPLLTVLLTSLTLSGCFIASKPDIEQGNLLSVEKLHLLHVGMDKAQVVGVLGSPILVNIFDDNRLVYVYTLKPGRGEFQAKQLLVYFSQGRVTHFITNIRENRSLNPKK